MRRISIVISVIICLILIHQIFSRSTQLQSSVSAILDLSQNNSCGCPTFVVENQSDASASLTILEAGCGGEYSWKAQIELKNLVLLVI